MPVTGPTHVNPFIDGADFHTPSPAPSPTPEGPAVTSSRPIGSTGPLERLGALRVRTNRSDTPTASTNPFDTPRASTNPFDTPRASTNPFDTPRASANRFHTPSASTNPFDLLSVDSHPSGEAGTEHVLAETPSMPRPVSVQAPRANTAAAFAKLRNRQMSGSPLNLKRRRVDATPPQDEAQHDVSFPNAAPASPPDPDRPRVEGAPQRDEAQPHAEFAEAPHGEPPAPTGLAARPHSPPNSAAEFAEETMEQTGEFMSPMIQAQMFAAESQMFISMVQAQVDVAKAAASAVSDAARKS